MVHTPKTFVQLVVDAGFKEQHAAELFRRVMHKKSVRDHADAVALELNLHPDEVNRTFTLIKKEYRSHIIHNALNKEDFIPQNLIEEAHAQFERLIGKSKSTKPFKTKSTLEKAISDIHFPFADEKSIERVFETHAKRLYILGDIFDFYAASRHRKTLDVIHLRQELALGKAFLQRCSSHFGEVILIEGNHDKRIVRLIQDLAPVLIPFIVNPLHTISHGLENVTVASTVISGTKPDVEHGEDYEAMFMAEHKGVLMGHFERFCGDRAPQQVESWINDWNHILPEEVVKADVICQAHTHRLGLNYTPKGKVLIATGCLCKPMPYQFEQHGTYSPPTQGFITWNRDEKDRIIKDSISVIKI